MNIDIELQQRVLIVHIHGDIDHHSASLIKDKVELEFTHNHARHIVFDFKSVSFMDSSGIGMVIGRYKYVQQQGGKVAVAALNDSLSRIFDISGLYKIIKSYDSIETAVQALS